MKDNMYTWQAQHYQAVLDAGAPGIDREQVARSTKAYAVMGELEEAERLELLNTGAFNEAILGYVMRALDTIDACKADRRGSRNGIVAEIRDLLDHMTAEEAQEYYYTH